MTTQWTQDLQPLAAAPEIVPLGPTEREQAATISQVLRPSRRTQAYLNVLALFGFAAWLQQRAPELALQIESCTNAQRLRAELLDATCNVQVGGFQVCLLPTLSWSDAEVALPRAVVDLPEFNAHFYILVGIDEDLHAAAVIGALRRDRLTTLQADLDPQIDWTYALPRNQFNANTDELLLDLQCLEPVALPLPAAEPIPDLSPQQRDSLTEHLLNLGDRPLWEVLTWPQSATLLRQPRLLEWLQRTATGDRQSLNRHLTDLLQLISQPAVNVGLWLHERAEELTTGFQWQLVAEPALRRVGTQTPGVTLASLLNEIERNTGTPVPARAGRGYLDLEIGGGVRVYAVAWSLSYEDNWILLLILGAIPGHPTPHGLQWRIADETDTLIEETLLPQRTNDYLFAQVIGSYAEKFLVTVTDASGATETLPPFEFCLQ
ncbi:MAG: DUF1822 family protein [Spirulinaceae cyanobacterium RM2_2_10]|nr:DUF1822 family protein [Spirulinaceae cyanobacterium SM2_1_0]NJO20178.1 DUF1822 family protein [Spirulinaceae cyanobacterium RM2_2_10]